MPEPIRVLYWGTQAEAACAYYRGHLYDEPLRELGIETRHIDRLETDPHFVDARGRDVDWRAIAGPELERRVKSNELRFKLEVTNEPLNWCDIIVFRRFYNLAYRCARTNKCEFRTFDEAAARAHPHGIEMMAPGFPLQDPLTEFVWREAAKQRDKGIIYETDDLLLRAELCKWNGLWPDMHIAEPMVREMASRADLVTVSTPELGEQMTPLNPRTIVIRNAIDPAIYVPSEPRPDDPRTRAVYYGSSVRVRDFAGERNDVTGKWEGTYPVDAVRDQGSRVKTIFLGATPEYTPLLRGIFSDVRPYENTIAGFGRALANTHGDIGVAGLMEDDFNRCKSELHWLEYSACGMATIASRFGPKGRFDGPFSVIRHGVDGVLAKGRQEWHDGIKLLLDKSRREDIAAAAKERVLAEYDHRKRAVEWADAFRWVNDHRGIGA